MYKNNYSVFFLLIFFFLFTSCSQKPIKLTQTKFPTQFPTQLSTKTISLTSSPNTKKTLTPSPTSYTKHNPTIIQKTDSPLVTPTINTNCAYHSISVKQTILNLISAEEKSMLTEDISIANAVFSSPSLCRNYKNGKSWNCLNLSKEIYDVFDYKLVDHYNINFVKIERSKVYVTNSVRLEFIQQGHDKPVKENHTGDYDHRIYKINENGCWELAYLSWHSNSQPFPP